MLNLITNPLGVISLSKREIYRFITVASQTLFPPLISSTLFIYIFGVAIGSRIDFSTTGLNYFNFIVPGLMCMHLISSSYENTSSSLFIARWHNHIQEILLSPLSYFEMVLGLLSGGIVRGFLVVTGVFLVSLIFSITHIHHPFLLLYFIISISIIFSCAGMMSALWAEDFSMLNMWNVYLILPLVLLGGVFHPFHILPKVVQTVTFFNPIYYLINGMRYSVSGISDVPILFSVVFSFVLMMAFFFHTVHLFKVGYKLRS